MVVSRHFSASRYWTGIIESGATVTNMLGVIGAILWKQPSSPQERMHWLRQVMAVPLPDGYVDEFERRFGVPVTELYGSTDTGLPLAIPYQQRRPGSCSVPEPGWEVALADENDERVPPGTPGELLTRPAEPWIGQLGYWKQPDKTWKAHRNAWIHTGDSLVQDDEGWFYFSSFEVEQVVLTHPGVAEAAVFAIPNELREDTIMLAVVLEDGVQLDPAELIEFIAPGRAYFAVPRYVDVVDALPKTPTQKIQKAQLWARGLSGATWDGGPRRRGSSRPPWPPLRTRQPYALWAGFSSRRPRQTGASSETSSVSSVLADVLPAPLGPSRLRTRQSSPASAASNSPRATARALICLSPREPYMGSG